MYTNDKVWDPVFGKRPQAATSTFSAARGITKPDHLVEMDIQERRGKGEYTQISISESYPATLKFIEHLTFCIFHI